MKIKSLLPLISIHIPRLAPWRIAGFRTICFLPLRSGGLVFLHPPPPPPRQRLSSVAPMIPNSAHANNNRNGQGDDPEDPEPGCHVESWSCGALGAGEEGGAEDGLLCVSLGAFPSFEVPGKIKSPQKGEIGPGGILLTAMVVMGRKSRVTPAIVFIELLSFFMMRLSCWVTRLNDCIRPELAFLIAIYVSRSNSPG